MVGGAHDQQATDPAIGMNRDLSTFISITQYPCSPFVMVTDGRQRRRLACASNRTGSPSPRWHGRTVGLNGKPISGNRLANYIANVTFKPSTVTIRNPERPRSSSKSWMPSMPSTEGERDVRRGRRIATRADVQRSVRSSRTCGDRIRQVSARHALRSSSNTVYRFAPSPSSPRLDRRPRFTPTDGGGCDTGFTACVGH